MWHGNALTSKDALTLYQNRTDFGEVGSSAGVADSNFGIGAAWGDYDGTVCVGSGESIL